MLSSIEVFNAVGTSMGVLPILNPSPTSEYVIKKIRGIEPPKADIHTSPYAIQDGGFFQSSRSGERNIVLTLGYGHPNLVNKTGETLRRELYSTFPPKNLVKLRIFNDDPAYKTVEIIGYVETHLPTIFDKKPAVEISLVCPKPNFVELQTLTRTGATRDNIDFPYRGDADVGFVVNLYTQSDLTKVIISNGQVDQDLVLDFPSPNFLPKFRTLRISTIPGAKDVTVDTGQIKSSALDNITSGSLSMTLGPIVNKFMVDVIPLAGQSGSMPLDMTCTPAYIGL